MELVTSLTSKTEGNRWSGSPPTLSRLLLLLIIDQFPNWIYLLDKNKPRKLSSLFKLINCEGGSTTAMDRSMDMKKKKKKVTLISSNGKIFEVDLDMVVSECGHIRRMIENGMEEGFWNDKKILIREKAGGMDDNKDCYGDDKIIFRLPNITGKILALVLEYCTNHEDLKLWEAKLAELDEVVLAHLLLAATYLFMWEELVPLAGEVMSSKDKTPSEVVKIFSSKLDDEEE